MLSGLEFLPRSINLWRHLLSWLGGMGIIVLAMFMFALLAGTSEVALHGFRFFVFRAVGTGETSSNGLQEDQGPGQPDAPGAHQQLHSP